MNARVDPGIAHGATSDTPRVMLALDAVWE